MTDGAAFDIICDDVMKLKALNSNKIPIYIYIYIDF